MFYSVVLLDNVSNDTELSAVWIAEDVEGVDPNFVIHETVYSQAVELSHFELVNENLWLPGKYRLDLYLNGIYKRSLKFEVN